MSKRRPTRPDVATDLVAAASWADPCPGECNAPWRAQVEEHGDVGDLVPVLGAPVWCRDSYDVNHLGQVLTHRTHQGCTERIIDRLSALPDLASWMAPGRLITPHGSGVDRSLSTSAGGHSAKTTSGARAMSHAPSPSPAWDSADELIRWLIDLSDWLAARARIPAQSGTRRTLSGEVGYLRTYATALLSSPDAIAIGRDILSTHRRLQTLLGQDRLTHRLSEPCPLCATKALRRKDGDEMVKCVACLAAWDWDHFELLARTYAQSVREQARGAS